MPRRTYKSAEIDSAINDAVGSGDEPQQAAPAAPSSKQVFSRAAQTPAQQDQFKQLIKKQQLEAEKLRNR